jgi:hypothetical protein
MEGWLIGLIVFGVLMVVGCVAAAVLQTYDN